MTITSKYASKCQCCNRQINPGDQINWVKGVKGVTCADCPMPRSTPAHGTPAGDSLAMIAQLVQQRDAQAADATALRKRIGEIEAAFTVARNQLHAVITDRDAANRQLVALHTEIAALKADRRVGPLAQLPPEDTATPHPYASDDDCPI